MHMQRALTRSSNVLISVVLPCLNEADVLEELVDRIERALERSGYRYEIVFVNDGSTDGSDRVLDCLAGTHDSLRVVHFSRNFGHQAAVQAGLLHASGDAVVVMDSDMQDDPDAIADLLRAWKEGHEVVYAVRVNRKESWWKRLMFFSFYRVLNLVSHMSMPYDAGNFSLLDRAVVDQVVQLADRDRYFPGLRFWVGFRQIGVPIERRARHDARPRVSLGQLCRLAKSAVFSFSSLPLAAFYAVASVALCVFCGLSGFTLYHKLLTGLAIPGWTSITIVASFFGAVNSFGIAILGEYVVRIYDQVRARPLFVVSQMVNFETISSVEPLRRYRPS